MLKLNLNNGLCYTQICCPFRIWTKLFKKCFDLFFLVFMNQLYCFYAAQFPSRKRSSVHMSFCSCVFILFPTFNHISDIFSQNSIVIFLLFCGRFVLTLDFSSTGLVSLQVYLMETIGITTHLQSFLILLSRSQVSVSQEYNIL